MAPLFEREMGYKLNAKSIRPIEAMQVLCSGLRNLHIHGEKIIPHNIISSLTKHTFHTIMGTMYIDEFGDTQRPMYEIVIEKGRYVNRGDILHEH